MTVQVLKAQLAQRDDQIHTLLQQMMFTDASFPISIPSSIGPLNLPTVGNSYSTSNPSLSPPPQVVSSGDYTPISPVPFLPNEESIPSTYSEVISKAIQSPTILRRPKSPPQPSNPRSLLQKKYHLTIIYFTGLPVRKLGEFRKHAKQIGLSLHSVLNISFIGTSIVEILIESNVSQAFIDQAKSLGFNVVLDLDITTKSKHNPVVMEYSNSGANLSDVIKSNFIRRISHEIKSCFNKRVRQYYLDWAEMLNWKDSLLVASTSASSP